MRQQKTINFRCPITVTYDYILDNDRYNDSRSNDESYGELYDGLTAQYKDGIAAALERIDYFSIINSWDVVLDFTARYYDDDLEQCGDTDDCPNKLKDIVFYIGSDGSDVYFGAECTVADTWDSTDSANMKDFIEDICNYGEGRELGADPFMTERDEDYNDEGTMYLYAHLEDEYYPGNWKVMQESLRRSRPRRRTMGRRNESIYRPHRRNRRLGRRR